mmetsp:Transcript_9301/g.16491  ORF Transcript_9301/g.16491 Transcript_9301/m.16491 type:complete len:251 (-) Transcript_9301:983-1735(-)
MRRTKKGVKGRSFRRVRNGLVHRIVVSNTIALLIPTFRIPLHKSRIRSTRRIRLRGFIPNTENIVQPRLGTEPSLGDSRWFIIVRLIGAIRHQLPFPADVSHDGEVRSIHQGHLRYQQHRRDEHCRGDDEPRGKVIPHQRIVRARQEGRPLAESPTGNARDPRRTPQQRSGLAVFGDAAYDFGLRQNGTQYNIFEDANNGNLVIQSQTILRRNRLVILRPRKILILQLGRLPNPSPGRTPQYPRLRPYRL